jgi:hypothetical protein
MVRNSPFAFVIVLLLVSATRAGNPHTFDGKHDISTIDLTVVYFVPKDRTPLPDWRERVDYYVDRITKFHTRESGGTSTLKVHVHPEPLIPDKTAEQIRGDKPDDTFFRSTGEAAKALGWHEKKREGFPILLVLSEINWRELDDFTRTRTVDGKPTFEGNLSPNGRHFPGAESGGARAIYDGQKGLGMGLVSADGWRVPYSGSDCVVYHEGVGHAIGLPHPDPGDDSVMCFAQYNYWINQTWVTPSQKAALGWPKGDGKVPFEHAKSKDLFTAFTALQDPIAPSTSETIKLKLTWPEGAKVKGLRISLQTELLGPWISLPNPTLGTPPTTLTLGEIDRPTPVSYRVNATLEDGQTVELRGYFQVKVK